MRKLKCLTVFVSALTAFGLMTGCQKAADTSNNAANRTGANAPANTNKTETASMPANANQTETGTTAGFSLATPTDAYKTAYAARDRKDIATLKKTFSKDILGF